MKKIALITGINGQDGYYLSNLLLSKNYHVIGISKKPNNNHKIENILGDITCEEFLFNTIKTTKPNEIYNFAAKSKPAESWEKPIDSLKVNSLAPVNIFEASKKFNPDCKIFQASSAEIFASALDSSIKEDSTKNPINPYGAAKLYAHNMAKIYRESFGMFISTGILFNHESPMRGMNFISQKITYAAACIKSGIQNSKILNERGEPIVQNGKIALGNLDARRDFGFAGDYVEAMWLMLQQDNSDDFIIATGETRSIRELCKAAFNYVNLNYEDYVVVNKSFIRPAETNNVTANISKSAKILNWQPKTNFNSLIAELIEHHLTKINNNLKISEKNLPLL